MLAGAEVLHAAGTLLADLRRTVDASSVWSRVPGGRLRALETYQRLCDRLSELDPRAPILDELRTIVRYLAASA
jgi:hypothetical protein